MIGQASAVAVVDLLPTREWHADIPRSTRTATIASFVVLGSFILGFGLWASRAPIAGAIVTTGTFISDGQNKIVQHLEGAVIQNILVSEGDLVEKGQLLVKLEDVSPKSELRRLALRFARLQAAERRLNTVMREERVLSFPPDLAPSIGLDDLAAITEDQHINFNAFRRNLDDDVAVLQDGVSALREKIKGTEVQLESVNQQLAFFEDELSGKMSLLSRGLIRKSDVLAIQRARANSQGEIGRLTGDIGDARERISRIEQQINGARSEAIKRAADELQTNRADQSDVREKMKAARDVMERTEIRAPASGAVVSLRYHTSGGVVEAGKNILEIVPVSADLLLEADVRPQDIDQVRVGEKAGVRLTALSQRLTPMINGVVVYVSADAVPDQQRSRMPSNGDRYVTRIRLDPGELSRIHGFRPTSGMPAEVYIKTADRTFLEYLVKPIVDSMSRAFRER